MYNLDLMARDVLLTRTGFEKLKRELEHLKTVERPAIAEAIREAKSHGDLRENAAYHEAKLKQSRLEGRIADLQRVLETAKIVERPETGQNVAHLGSRVRLLIEEFDEEIEVTLVGSFEADPKKDLVSITSPLGSALVGAEPGLEIEVDAPAGICRYKVREVVDPETGDGPSSS